MVVPEGLLKNECLMHDTPVSTLLATKQTLADDPPQQHSTFPLAVIQQKPQREHAACGAAKERLSEGGRRVRREKRKEVWESPEEVTASLSASHSAVQADSRGLGNQR